MTRSLATLALATLSLAACSDAEAPPADAPVAPVTQAPSVPDETPAQVATPTVDDRQVITGEPDDDEVALPPAPLD